jgi:hypothetical protein
MSEIMVPLGIPSHKWEGNNIIGFWERNFEFVNWIELAQDIIPYK